MGGLKELDNRTAVSKSCEWRFVGGEGLKELDNSTAVSKSCEGRYVGVGGEGLKADNISYHISFPFLYHQSLIFISCFVLYSQSLVAIGSLNGLLSIWDVPTQKLRHQCRTEVNDFFTFLLMIPKTWISSLQ